jgi:general stress protein 26
MDRQQSIEKLRSLIKDVKFAMLTTVDEDGSLRSRPMVTQTSDFDGTLWFFTRRDSGKVDEVEREQQVNVSYANPSKEHYVSVSGTARVVADRAKIDELWSPVLKAWFPQGKDDPAVGLLKVEVDKAEYWDSPSSTMVKIAGFIKSITTGKVYKPGTNERVDLHGEKGRDEAPARDKTRA